MRDIVILAVIAAFFALGAAYVRWCDHIIGPDPDIADDDQDLTVAGIGERSATVAADAEVVRA